MYYYCFALILRVFGFLCEVVVCVFVLFAVFAWFACLVYVLVIVL